MVYYSNTERRGILTYLHLDPDIPRVGVSDALAILSWRLRVEHASLVPYQGNALRRRARQFDAQPVIREDGTIHTRKNTYSVDRLFTVPLLPQRANNHQKSTG